MNSFTTKVTPQMKSMQFICKFCHSKFQYVKNLQLHLNDFHTNARANFNNDSTEEDNSQSDDESTLFSNQSQKLDSEYSPSLSPNQSQESQIEPIHTQEIDSVHKPNNKRKRNGINNMDDENWSTVSQSLAHNTNINYKRVLKKRKIAVQNTEIEENIENHNIFDDIEFRVNDNSLKCMFGNNNEMDDIVSDTESDGEIMELIDIGTGDNNEKTLNRQSSAEWKKLLNGNPNICTINMNRNKGKRRNKNIEKMINDKDMCSTCHTFEVIKGNSQCVSCNNNKLGMPFCTNCESRLSYEDYKKWLKYNDVTDMNDDMIDEILKCVVLCQTCFICCKEFL
eukprot:330629_1